MRTPSAENSGAIGAESGKDGPRESWFRPWVLVSEALLLQLAGTLLLAHVGFVAGVPLAAWSWVLGCVFGVAWIGGRSRTDALSMGPPLAVYGLFLVVAIVASSLCLDFSYDGQWYHTDAILSLAEGWNPVRNPTGSSHYAVIYPRGAEIYGTALWKLVPQTIEITKAGSWVALFASAGVTLRALAISTTLNRRSLMGLAAVAVLNPVTIRQLTTTMVDGIFGSCVLILVALVVQQVRKREPYRWILLAAASFALVDVKTSGLLIGLFTGAVVMLVPMIGRWVGSSLGSEETARTVWSGVAVTLAIAISSVVVYNPYVSNTSTYGTPLYPAFHKDAPGILTAQRPADFRGISNFSRLFGAAISVPQSDLAPSKVDRNPLMMNGRKVMAYVDPDTRIKGFGPYTIFLDLAILVGWVALFRTDRKRAWSALIGMVAIWITVVGAGEGWWARIVPQAWLIPVWLVACMSVEVYRRYGRPIVAIAAINIAIVGGIGFAYEAYKVRKWKTQVAQLRTAKMPLLLRAYSTDMARISVRLKEAGFESRRLSMEEAAKRIGAPLAKIPIDQRLIRLGEAPNSINLEGSGGVFAIDSGLKK